MLIRIVQDACCGSGLCSEITGGEVFTHAGEGESVGLVHITTPKGTFSDGVVEVDPDGHELRERVIEAVEGCPLGAIRFVEG